jgi:hypothetical protein
VRKELATVALCLLENAECERGLVDLALEVGFVIKLLGALWDRTTGLAYDRDLLTVPLAPIPYFKMQSYRQTCAHRELSIHRLRQQKRAVMTRWSYAYDEADDVFDQVALWKGRHLVK